MDKSVLAVSRIDFCYGITSGIEKRKKKTGRKEEKARERRKNEKSTDAITSFPAEPFLSDTLQTLQCY